EERSSIALAMGSGHLVFGWFFVANGVVYAIHLSRNGNWRYLIPDTQGVKDASKVVLHDLLE
ncbi:hypothetical protein, partial [Klebsiella aerogenes]|uniref:hypothetical protein n=1 Tax=Klebsiella aerogenes TaxID=548 RepID=UPI001953F885